jgi:hypothetical protein
VTPPAPVAAAPTGEALIAYDLIETLGGKSVSRVHYRKLALLPRGAACTGAGGCADGICARGFCCDTPCDGICQACDSSGCIQTPATDDRCGASGPLLACANLSTVCRTYEDQPLNRCIAFGQCAESGSLAECDRYSNAPDGTPCSSAACASGSCTLGTCECDSGKLPASSPRSLVSAPSGGCDVGGGGRDGIWPLLLLALWLARRGAPRRAR